jgi:single-stranded DNA-binding protein
MLVYVEGTMHIQKSIDKEGNQRSSFQIILSNTENFKILQGESEYEKEEKEEIN